MAWAANMGCCDCKPNVHEKKQESPWNERDVKHVTNSELSVADAGLGQHFVLLGLEGMANFTRVRLQK